MTCTLYFNNEIVIIEAAYLHEGEWWGVMQVNHVIQPPGWIPMSEHLLIYEQKDFERDNKIKLYNYTGRHDTILVAEQLVFWQWSGSDRGKWVINYNNYEEFEIKNIRITSAYNDLEGRIWAHIDFSFSYKSSHTTYPDGSSYY